MNHTRRIVTVAAAGAAVSGLVSLNRKLFDQLLYFRRRKQRIEELRLWYESELQKIEQYAEEKSVLFVDEYRDRFLATIADEEHSEAAVKGALAAFRISMRHQIQLNQRAQVTRKYGIRLGKVSPDKAYEQKENAADLMASEAESADRMRMAEYPVNELYAWLLKHKRM